jgi:ABC-type multidrug transport system ATPase subunit
LHPQQIKLLALAAMSIGVQLMVLDEPSVGLDSDGIGTVLDFIESLRRDGVAIVVISHDEVFAQLSDRILRFDNGRCAVAHSSQPTEA